MLDFESARQRFVEIAPLGGSDRVPLLLALGRVLAEPLLAAEAVPQFDASAMDGYALNADELSLMPYELPVVGEAPAGAAPAVLQRGTAMRIFTGAAVPAGANAVVMQEHVERVEQVIRGTRSVAVGQNIRQRGEDLPKLGQAIGRGQRLHPAALALVSFLDRAEVLVTSAPRVRILSTGSELRAPGSVGHPGTIAESISPVLMALTRQAGAVVAGAEIVDDDPQRIQRAIDEAIIASDVLVTIGGVSVGDYDFVRPALEAVGVSLELHQVGIKPGKPIAFGRRGSKLVIGLPGNPASAVATFALFAMPLLRALQGDNRPIPTPTWVPLVAPIKRDRTRTRIVFGNLAEFDGRSGFIAHANQASGATIALGQTDGMAILAAGEAAATTGTLWPYLRWSDV